MGGGGARLLEPKSRAAQILTDVLNTELLLPTPAEWSLDELPPCSATGSARFAVVIRAH